MRKLRIFIIDDEFPKTEEYIEQGVYESRIDSDKLLHLLNVDPWAGQPYLRRLVSDILQSVPAQDGRIETFGFSDPAICLSAIDEGLAPDIIVFDWEYGNITWSDSSKSLQEILKNTNAFVFIYSHVGQEIPPFVNKQEYKRFAKRFQLFLKGEDKASVFSSEEFIVQYVVSRLDKNGTIKLHGIDVRFDQNGYLKNPSDILQLEDILGRAFLLKQLEAPGSAINDKTIEALLQKSDQKLWYSNKSGYLISAGAPVLMAKHKPDEELSCAEAAKRFGLLKLREAIESGIARV